MTTPARYSRRQLLAAKAMLATAASAAGGLHLADAREDVALMSLVLWAMLIGVLALYELASHGLALVIGRVSRRRAPEASSESPVDPAAPSPSPRLRPWHGVVVLTACLGAQAVVWLVGLLAGLPGSIGGADEAAFAATAVALTPVLLPGGMAASGLVLVLALRRWQRSLDPRSFADVSPPLTARWPAWFGGIAAGLLLGGMMAVLMQLIPYEPTEPPSVLVQAAMRPGATRWAWVISALFLAPPIEEALFRGAVLGSLKQRWGIPAAAVMSGGAFWLAHATEWSYYWPAAIALAMMTVLVTTLRLRARNLASPIAAHFGYNLAVVFTAFGLE